MEHLDCLRASSSSRARGSILKTGQVPGAGGPRANPLCPVGRGWGLHLPPVATRLAQSGGRGGISQSPSPASHGCQSPGPGAIFAHTRPRQGLKRMSIYLPMKRTWQMLLPGWGSLVGGGGLEAPRMGSYQGQGDALAGVPPPQAGWASHQGDWPRPSGHMEAPPPDVPGLGFPAFGTGRPHKDGVHAEALNSLRNEAGFK